MKVCSSRWCNSCKSLPFVVDNYLIGNTKSFLCRSYGIIKSTKATGSHHSRGSDIRTSRWRQREPRHLCSWSASIHCCSVSTQFQPPCNTETALITCLRSRGHECAINIRNRRFIGAVTSALNSEMFALGDLLLSYYNCSAPYDFMLNSSVLRFSHLPFIT